MFVGYSDFSSNDGNALEAFTSRKTFPEAFTDVVSESWNVLIEDHYRMPAAGTLDAGVFCYLFYAKDRQTLKDGLRACTPDAIISGGRHQIGFFGGSYDFEKFGGWGRKKSKAAEKWKTLSTDQRRNVDRSRFDRMFNRQRLMERGYFLIVARAFLLPGRGDNTKLIGTGVSLPALGSMLSTKMTRQQAVGQLMEDLLVA